LTTTTAELFIEDNVFVLGDPDDAASPIHSGEIPTPDETGLIAAADGAVQITCGVNVGEVTVSVETWPEPPSAALADYDDVAEVSVRWTAGTVHVVGASVDDAPDIAIALPAAADGVYRVRDHARNRDAGEDRDESAPEEHHLLQIWAAPEEPPRLLKATDAVGAVWRT
jgi:hypothetical protein